MISFKQLILELADRPLPFKQKKKFKDYSVYHFQTEDQETGYYEVTIEKIEGLENSVSLEFVNYDENLVPSNGLTKTGFEFQVFSTIFKIMDEYAKKYKPKFIHFEAKGNQSSRKTLYMKAAKNYAPRYGYNLVHAQKAWYSFFTLFILKRNN